MPRRKDKNFATFNDGELVICRTKDRRIIETKYGGVRFGYQTVGIKRFYEAKIASSQVDEAVKIPMGPEVTTMDMCLIREKQYKIEQIQKKYDESPPCMLLSLRENKPMYEDMRK